MSASPSPLFVLIIPDSSGSPLPLALLGPCFFLLCLILCEHREGAGEPILFCDPLFFRFPPVRSRRVAVPFFAKPCHKSRAFGFRPIAFGVSGLSFFFLSHFYSARFRPTLRNYASERFVFLTSGLPRLGSVPSPLLFFRRLL